MVRVSTAADLSITLLLTTPLRPTAAILPIPMCVFYSDIGLWLVCVCVFVRLEMCKYVKSPSLTLHSLFEVSSATRGTAGP